MPFLEFQLRPNSISRARKAREHILTELRMYLKLNVYATVDHIDRGRLSFPTNCHYRDVPAPHSKVSIFGLPRGD